MSDPAPRRTSLDVAQRFRPGIAPTLVALGALVGWIGCGKAGLTLDLLRERHPEVLYSVEIEEPVVALTIDDGPDPASTQRILEVLEDNDARATFFIITDRISGNEALLERMVASGHELGNHLTRDVPSVDLEPETFERELVRSHEALATYAPPRWFRPGSGWHDERMLEVLERRGYRMALASDYPLDAHIPWSGFARRFLLWRVKPGAVILLHDAEGRGERTAETLAAVLPELRRQGYRVVSLSELVALADRSQEEETSSRPSLSSASGIPRSPSRISLLPERRWPGAPRGATSEGEPAETP